jgi:hypothetical protein
VGVLSVVLRQLGAAGVFAASAGVAAVDDRGVASGGAVDRVFGVVGAVDGVVAAAAQQAVVAFAVELGLLEAVVAAASVDAVTASTAAEAVAAGVAAQVVVVRPLLLA